ncbi:MAG: hypothetical protein ACHQAX_09210 [Gammaproteobacteria bacterium]
MSLHGLETRKEINDRLLHVMNHYEVLPKLIEECKPYLDSQFDIELKNEPYARLFELVICKNLLNHSDYLILEHAKNKPKKSPDFFIKSIEGKPCRIWIECVTSSFSKIEKKQKNMEEVILRLTGSIKSKHDIIMDVYRKSNADGPVIGHSDKVILALCSGGAGNDFLDLRDIILGKPYAIFDPDDHSSNLEINHKPYTITKNNQRKSKVKIGGEDLIEIVKQFDGIIHMRPIPLLTGHSHPFDFMPCDFIDLKKIFNWTPPYIPKVS